MISRGGHGEMQGASNEVIWGAGSGVFAENQRVEIGGREVRLVMGIGRAEKFAMGTFETLPHRATERGAH